MHSEPNRPLFSGLSADQARVLWSTLASAGTHARMAALDVSTGRRALARIGREAYDSAVALEREFDGLLDGLEMRAGDDWRVYLADDSRRFASAFGGAL